MDMPCRPRVPNGFETNCFLPWSSSNGGASDGNLIGITIGANGALKELNLGTSDVLVTWVDTPCEPRVPDDFETALFLPWGSSKGGASDGKLVGITIVAAVGVEETGNPSGIIIGAAVELVETEGFTNRPGDSLDGGPTTGATKGILGTIFNAARAGAIFCRSGARGAKGDLGAPSFAIFDGSNSCLEGNFSKGLKALNVT
jgi:hypothetical protein